MEKVTFGRIEKAMKVISCGAREKRVNILVPLCMLEKIRYSRGPTPKSFFTESRLINCS
jgi:hypothetical protein